MKVKRFGRSHVGKRTLKLGSSISKHCSNVQKNRKGAVSGAHRRKKAAVESNVAGPSEVTVRGEVPANNVLADGNLPEGQIPTNMPQSCGTSKGNERRILCELDTDDRAEDTSNLECIEDINLVNCRSEPASRSESSATLFDSPVKGTESRIPMPLSDFTNLRPARNTLSPRNEQMTSTRNQVMTVNRRKMPPQLQHSTSGDHKEVWELMCAKNEIYVRSSCMMDAHPEILLSMRTVLFDWMMDVCEAEKLHRETFYLSMEYVDRFLSSTENLPSSKLQLFGTVALHIACKFEEVYPPKLKVLVSYTDGACNAAEVREAERIMLKKLCWLLNPLTAVHWLGVYLLLLGMVENENADEKQWHVSEMSGDPAKAYNLLHDSAYGFSKVMRTTFINMAQVLDLCMLDPRSIQYDYAVLAAAVFWCYFEPDELIEELTGFQMEQLYNVCNFVEPYTYVWEKRRPLGHPLPDFEGIEASDLHNIQTHIDDYESLMKEAEEIRVEMSRANEPRHKRVNVIPSTPPLSLFSSPRPLAKMQNTFSDPSTE